MLHGWYLWLYPYIYVEIDAPLPSLKRNIVCVKFCPVWSGSTESTLYCTKSILVWVDFLSGFNEICLKCKLPFTMNIFNTRGKNTANLTLSDAIPILILRVGSLYPLSLFLLSAEKMMKNFSWHVVWAIKIIKHRTYSWWMEQTLWCWLHFFCGKQKQIKDRII